ncbi:hypothetical protein Vi05172_g3268 [Venturia inaequalis]|nr:hypothetical protein Vi05172_g3268 [Venturia inaequalis]
MHPLQDIDWTNLTLTMIKELVRTATLRQPGKCFVSYPDCSKANDQTFQPSRGLADQLEGIGKAPSKREVDQAGPIAQNGV